MISYVRYIDNGEFTKEILFYGALKTITIVINIYIYKELKNYLGKTQLSMKNITSCAMVSVPVTIGKKSNYLKLMKGDNSEISFVHCIIRNKNLVSKKCLPVLNIEFNSKVYQHYQNKCYV